MAPKAVPRIGRALIVAAGAVYLGSCVSGSGGSAPPPPRSSIFRSDVIRWDSGGERPFGLLAPAISGGGGVTMAITHQEADLNTLSIAESNGDGTFSVTQQLDVTALAPDGTAGVGRGVVAADFDRDGDLDLVMADTVELDRLPLCEMTPFARASNVLVFLNDGGIFVPGEVLIGGLRSQTPAVGDVNGDDILDIVIDNRHGDFCVGPGGTVPNTGLAEDAPNPPDRRNGIGNTQVFLGNGDATFTDIGSFGECASAHFLAVADFNEDGRDDIAMPCNIDQGQIAVLFGNPDGSLGGQVDLTSDFDTIPRPHQASTADLNGDGHIDIATAHTNREFPPVSVFLGDGLGGFAESESARFSLGDLDGLLSSFLTIADVTGPNNIEPDGILDLVVIKSTGTTDVLNFVVVLVGDGEGGFTHATDLGSPFEIGAGRNIRVVSVGDFNDDGLPDVAVPEFGSSDPIRRDIAVLLHE